MPHLVPVPPADLRRMWPVVRPMIEGVRERCKSNWLAEDVYSALVAQEALLHIANDEDGDACGCLVTQRKNDWGAPHLFVWVCFHRHQDRTISDYWPEIQKLAKALGLPKIRCESPRAYQRVLPMTPLYTVFEGNADGQ